MLTILAMIKGQCSLNGRANNVNINPTKLKIKCHAITHLRLMMKLTTTFLGLLI